MSKFEKIPYVVSFVKAIDGRDLEFEIDFGFDFFSRQRFSLNGIQCWPLSVKPMEKRNGAYRSKNFVEEELQAAVDIRVYSHRVHSFYLADVMYRKEGDKKWRNLSKALLKQGLASKTPPPKKTHSVKAGELKSLPTS